jgi:hypothetical protein
MAAPSSLSYATRFYVYGSLFGNYWRAVAQCQYYLHRTRTERAVSDNGARAALAQAVRNAQICDAFGF